MIIVCKNLDIMFCIPKLAQNATLALSNIKTNKTNPIYIIAIKR